MAKPHPALEGIPVKEIARICQVDLATARRWKRGAFCPPHTALMLLRGDLGCFDAAWAGWIIRNGELVSPEGWCITRNDVLCAPLLRAQVATYQRENRKLRRALDIQDFPEEQPLPDQPLPDSVTDKVK
jgi:hypothetical protein